MEKGKFTLQKPEAVIFFWANYSLASRCEIKCKGRGFNDIVMGIT